jgi:hypothetical protein
MVEAADLGVRLVQAHARSAWACYAPLWLAVAALALASVEIAGWLPWAILFCAKPWLDRTLLFVFSRAAFGERTGWSDLWSAQRDVWWRDLPWTLTLARLSGWRAYTAPLRQLEGQRGRGYLQRRRQIERGKRGSASMLQLVFAHLEGVIVASLYALAVWFAPGEDHFALLTWLNDPAGPGPAFAGNAAYALAVLALEPFYVAAGFAMYLNRRVELEAWDVEQEFRHAFAAR